MSIIVKQEVVEDEVTLENNNEITLRPMVCEFNHLPAPDGSVMLMQGNTAIIVGVYGPVEGKSYAMSYNKATIDVSFNPVKGPDKVDDRLTELYVKETSENVIVASLHPNTAINIKVQEIEDCGGSLACIINATCLALINAAVPMKFTVAAVNCMISKSSGEIIFDPDELQLEESRAEFTYAFDSLQREIICSYATGSFTQEEFLETIEKCKQASQFVFDYYRKIMQKCAKAL